MDDFLTIHQDLSITYKEYLGWSRLIYGTDMMATNGLPARLIMKRVLILILDCLNVQRYWYENV